MFPLYSAELTNIYKSFGGVKALSNVSIKIEKGTIHSIVGQNGAGKSTLIKILSGAIEKGSGRIKIDGNEVKITSPHIARKLGIQTIYQELTLVPDLSVAENIFLSHLSDSGFVVRRKLLNKKATQLISELGYQIDPSEIAGKLSIAYQQVVEITKALAEECNIVILDEPTAVLTPKESEKLFELLLQLKNEGVSVIYISHRIEEVLKISDKISILKDGEMISQVNTSDTNYDDIVQMMIGKNISTYFPKRNNTPGENVFSVTSLYFHGKNKDVKISVGRGEILGLTGLVGSGRTETLRAIFGAGKAERASVQINSEHFNIKSPNQAIRNGIALMPEDRKNDGLILSMSVKTNTTITMLERIKSFLNLIDRKKEIAIVEGLIDKLKIKTESLDSPAESLSGGNQQKVVLAKWLGRGSKIILLDEPTRGVDVGAKVEIYNLLNELSKNGIAIIMVSSDTNEITGMCDRALVMKNGEISDEICSADLTEENLLRVLNEEGKGKWN